MAAAEESAVATPVPAAKPKKERVAKSPEERKEARSALLQLLLIVLVGVSIGYFGFHLGIGIIGFVLWILGRVTGVA